MDETTGNKKRQTKKYRIAQVLTSIGGEVKDNQIAKNLSLVFNGINIPELRKRIRELNVRTQLNVPTNLSNFKVDGNVSVDNFRPLRFALDADNSSQKLTASHQVKINLDQELDSLHEGAAVLRKLGSFSVNLTGHHELTHGSETVLEANFDDLKKIVMDTNNKISISRKKFPTRKPLAKISGPVEIQMTTKMAEGQLKNDLTITAPQIWAEPLRSPVNLFVKTEQNVQIDAKQGSLLGEVALSDRPVLAFKINGKDSRQSFKGQLEVTAFAEPRLKRYLKELQALQQVGSVMLTQKVEINFKHPHQALSEAKKLDLRRWKGTVKAMTSVNQTAPPASHVKDRVILTKPLTIDTQVALDNNRAGLTQKISLPSAQIEKIAGISDLAIAIEADVLDPLFSGPTAFIPPQNIDVGVDLNSSQVKVTAPQIDTDELLKNLELQLQAKLQNNQKVILRKLTVKSGDKFFNLAKRASIDIKKLDGQTEGLIKIRLPTQLAKKPATQGKGSFGINWEVFIAKGKDLALGSFLQFNKVTVRNSDLLIRNLNGRVELKESINVINNKLFQFSELKSLNPFNRVDFQRVRPFLNSDHSLTIDKIKFKNWHLGPFSSNLEIDQNLISAPSFALKLFGGDLSGQFYFDSYPKALKLGILARFTKINPNFLVTEGKAASSKKTTSTISGSVALTFDLRKRLATGKVNITEIGGEQLVRLLDVIDPNYEDPDLNNLRNLLSLGYPERLSIQMKHGIMDMSVDVSITGVTKNQQIFGIPLTAIIESAAGEQIAQLIKDYEAVYPLNEISSP